MNETDYLVLNNRKLVLKACPRGRVVSGPRAKFDPRARLCGTLYNTFVLVHAIKWSTLRLSTMLFIVYMDLIIKQVH